MTNHNGGGMKLSSLFTPEQVACCLGPVTHAESIRLLIDKLKEAKSLDDPTAAFKAIMDREALASTVLLPGLAIPHARLEQLSGPVMAVATSAQGIPFPTEAEGRAKVVIMILTGVTEAGEYLQVLAGVARMFQDAAVVARVASLSTPERVWEFFDRGGGPLPDFVTAADMMRNQVVTLHHTDTLATTIDAFCQHHLYEIPVLDDDDELVGIVAEEEILRLCLPEYILWLEDLQPILQFESFNEVMKDEHVTRLAEIMSKRFVTVTEDTPAIQVARELMRQGARKILVTRGKKLVGVITLSHFLERVFRG